MLDPQLLRKSAATVAASLLDRGYVLDTAGYTELEGRRKTLQQQVQELQNQRNTSAKSIGQAKARGEDIQPLLEKVKQLGEQLDAAESQFREVRDQQLAWHLDMPNIASDDVPVGEDESANLEIRRWGDIPSFDFQPLDHVALGERNGLLDRGGGQAFRSALHGSAGRLVAIASGTGAIHARHAYR